VFNNLQEKTRINKREEECNKKTVNQTSKQNKKANFKESTKEVLKEKNLQVNADRCKFST